MEHGTYNSQAAPPSPDLVLQSLAVSVLLSLALFLFLLSFLLPSPRKMLRLYTLSADQLCSLLSRKK